ncbi:MAG: DUF5715 family protein [Bacteroidales bacterium]|jgi:hypothetical protein|nr:DUF5715 family protein [Bacteroidales bacterium]
MRRIRLKKKYRLKVWGFLFGVFSLCFILLPQSNRAFVASYFSKKCRNHQQVYSRKLTDRIPDYSAQARLTGIRICNDENDLTKRVLSGQLVRVRGGSNFRIESMKHSYPYLTRDSRRLLNEIGRRYRQKIGKEGLKGSRFIITSMTRTSENIKGLGKTNMNASENSPHLNGNAFDISYARFSIRKFRVTECDKWYMKEALAEVIYDLRKERKCWATYEKQQGCFHIVSRQ